MIAGELRVSRSWYIDACGTWGRDAKFMKPTMMAGCLVLLRPGLSPCLGFASSFGALTFHSRTYKLVQGGNHAWRPVPCGEPLLLDWFGCLTSARLVTLRTRLCRNAILRPTRYSTPLTTLRCHVWTSESMCTVEDDYDATLAVTIRLQ